MTSPGAALTAFARAGLSLRQAQGRLSDKERRGQAGYEAHHVVELGKAGAKDYQLREPIVKEEFVFVTNDAKDFKRLVEKTELHPGLVIVVRNARPAVRDELFRSALAKIKELASIINKVIEIWGAHDVKVFDLPALE